MHAVEASEHEQQRAACYMVGYVRDDCFAAESFDPSVMRAAPRRNAENGKEQIFPTAQTGADGTYQALSRLISIYVSKRAAAKVRGRGVHRFSRADADYLEHERARRTRAPQQLLRRSRAGQELELTKL